MNITFESKGDFNEVRKWLDTAINSKPTMALSEIASEGKANLASNTPRDTGETAAGWQAEITTKGSVSEIAWTNNAHPETNVNVAVIIDQGHGTGTGGYVQPRPYIKKSMDSIFATAGDKVVKELVK